MNLPPPAPASTSACPDWLKASENHQNRILPLITPHLERKNTTQKHPIEDFLWEYYSFRPHKLLLWTPGINRTLPPEAIQKLKLPHPFTKDSQANFYLSPHTFPEKRREGANWISDLLKNTLTHTPNFACFGLHEWAMTITPSDIRHPQLPLRLPHKEIIEITRSLPLCCTHYDAFRFFSKPARPWNKTHLTPQNRAHHEQPACLHANMDLYKWAYKIYPYVSSELLADCFLLALRIREVDMRASPYDLSEFKIPSIPIETETGRNQYITLQKEFAQQATTLRKKLLKTYQILLA